MTGTDDPLWPHFKPLWIDFQNAGEGILVAGGYGLYLKQQWLLEAKELQIAVPFERWTDAAPRATGDMDLVLTLDLISNETANKALCTSLEKEGFRVSEKPHGKRWQFFKEIAEGRHVAVEFHAPEPEENMANLEANNFAAKHKPSLNDNGIHGRINYEAIGGMLSPFSFKTDDVTINVPNPVTWTVMKLTAAADNWERSQDKKRTAKDQKFLREQSIKHGHDVCRVIALLTQSENDRSGSILEAIREKEAFSKAAKIYRKYFTGEDSWAEAVLAERWEPDDFTLILTILNSWFNEQN